MDKIEIILLGCSLITSLAAACAVIVSVARTVAAPNKRQNERLTELEADVSLIKKEIDDIKKENEAQKKVTAVTLQSLFALLSHGINGNSIEEMTKAKNALLQYLTEE